MRLQGFATPDLLLAGRGKLILSAAGTAEANLYLICDVKLTPHQLQVYVVKVWSLTLTTTSERGAEWAFKRPVRSKGAHPVWVGCFDARSYDKNRRKMCAAHAPFSLGPMPGQLHSHALLTPTVAVLNHVGILQSLFSMIGQGHP